MSIDKDETLLIFRIAGIPFAVPAQSVGSILMPPSHITHTPGSNRSTPGIFHHAEYTYAIVDLHERFGIDTPRLGSGRLLLQEEGIRHFAFLVDTVVGLVRSEQGRWAILPPYLPQELFSIGFLYQDEIVLCSELTLLRNMHDVEPLRRHFEQLQAQQGKPVVSDDVGAKSTPPTEIKTAEIAAKPVTPPEPTPAPPVKENAAEHTTPRVPVQATPKIKEPLPNTPPPSTAARRASVSVSQKKAATPPRSTTQTALPQRHREERSSLPRRPAAVTPAVPTRDTASPTVAVPERDSAMLWLLLFLLLLTALPLGYWLWPEPAREQRLAPSFAIPESPPVAVAEEPAVALPLRIERDDNGTINLIIDRQAAATEPSQPAQQEEPAIPTDAEEATTTPIQEKAVEEAGQPPVTAPQPCDCIHIVVKGDTLWDIAEQYTGDAFNYPQLAKRSGIKNPDRIYPGDRVRIIIR